MRAENSPDEDPSHALKRLLVKNANNQPKFFEDWRAFTEKNGHTPLFVPFIDEDTIKLLNLYIQSVKQTLDEVADQIFEIFRRLANPVMDRVTLQENLNLKESAKPLLGLVMLLKDICNSSDFYAKRYITSGSLEWTLSSLVLNDAILPNCKSAIIDSLEFMCKCSEEISVMLIHSHGPSLAYAVFSSPCVSVRFRLIHLLRSLFTQAASRLLMEKAQEWFPRNYELFVDISALADVLNFAYSAENSQVTSYVCRQVSALHLDRNHFLTPPVGFKKMWIDFDSKMKYLGFFFKPIMRKGVKESTDLTSVFYIIISEAIVERAEVELLKRSNDLQDLQLILYLRKELKELTNAPIYPIRHSRILFIAVEYDVHLLKIIQTIFSNVKINVGNVRLPLPATHTPSEDQAGTPESTFYGGLLDLNESTSKQATMSINDSMNGGTQMSTEFAQSRAQHDRQSVIGKEDQQLEVDDEDKQSMLDTEPGSTLDDENKLKTLDEELKEDNPFWYLEVPPLPKRRQPTERRNKTYSAKMGKTTKKVETSHDEETRNEAMQDEIDGIEKMFEEFSQKQKMKDEFSRKVEIIHAEIIDLFMQTGGYGWKEALREELARNKTKRECPLMASFRNICRKIDELDVDSWKKSNSQNNAQHVKKTLAHLEAFGNIRREGAEFL